MGKTLGKEWKYIEILRKYIESGRNTQERVKIPRKWGEILRKYIEMGRNTEEIYINGDKY